MSEKTIWAQNKLQEVDSQAWITIIKCKKKQVTMISTSTCDLRFKGAE